MIETIGSALLALGQLGLLLGLIASPFALAYGWLRYASRRAVAGGESLASRYGGTVAFEPYFKLPMFATVAARWNGRDLRIWHDTTPGARIGSGASRSQTTDHFTCVTLSVRPEPGRLHAIGGEDDLRRLGLTGAATWLRKAIEAGLDGPLEVREGEIAYRHADALIRPDRQVRLEAIVDLMQALAAEAERRIG